MEFKKDDENYIYELISKNIKKYRKLKGWTQEKLANEINYSLSFISGIESAYHQTFSLGAIWRIARVLGIDFYKLCIDESDTPAPTKYINFKCKTRGKETKIPIKIAKHFKEIYELTNNKDLPNFDCTSNNCSGKIYPTNPMDF